MNERLKKYIEEADKNFSFEIFADNDDLKYEEITKPFLSVSKNPDGSGPNKDRAAQSKMNEGFIYIVAKNLNGECVAAESFQVYTPTNQAIPAVVLYEAMNAYNAKHKETYSDVKTFAKEHKNDLVILESHRLLSTARGAHLAAVMIHKLEEYALSKYLPSRDSLKDKDPVFYETVNQYSRKAFELCDYKFTCDNCNYANERKMGSKIKYIGGKYRW